MDWLNALVKLAEGRGESTTIVLTAMIAGTAVTLAVIFRKKIAPASSTNGNLSANGLTGKEIALMTLEESRKQGQQLAAHGAILKSIKEDQEEAKRERREISNRLSVVEGKIQEG